MILEHNKKPRNYGDLSPRTHEAEGYNPLCGDHIWVHLNVEHNQLTAIQFKGDGCAICKASASMMTQALSGHSLDEVEVIISEFKRLVKGELDPDDGSHHLGRLTIFSGIWQYPARVKCAALAWHAASGALSQKQTVSTE